MTDTGTRDVTLSGATGRSGTLPRALLKAREEVEGVGSLASIPATTSTAATIAAAPIGMRLALRHTFSVVFPSLGAPAIGYALAIGGFASRFSDCGAATRSGSPSSIHSPVTPSSPPDLQMRSISRSASAAALARVEADSRLASRSRRRE